MAFLSFDLGSQIIDSLRIAERNLRQRPKDGAAIRATIQALHDALYGLLIEKLTRTDGFGVFDKKFEKKVGNFYSSCQDSRSSEFQDLINSEDAVNVASLGMLLERTYLESGVQIAQQACSELNRPNRGLNRLKRMRDLHCHPRPASIHYEMIDVCEACEDTLVVIKEVHLIEGHRSMRYDLTMAETLFDSLEEHLVLWRNSIVLEGEG